MCKYWLGDGLADDSCDAATRKDYYFFCLNIILPLYDLLANVLFVYSLFHLWRSNDSDASSYQLGSLFIVSLSFSTVSLPFRIYGLYFIPKAEFQVSYLVAVVVSRYAERDREHPQATYYWNKQDLQMSENLLIRWLRLMLCILFLHSIPQLIVQMFLFHLTNGFSAIAIATVISSGLSIFYSLYKRLFALSTQSYFGFYQFGAFFPYQRMMRFYSDCCPCLPPGCTYWLDLCFSCELCLCCFCRCIHCEWDCGESTE